jgi:hypothetical protein
MENPKIKIIREFKEYAYYNPLNVFKGLKKQELILIYLAIK